VMDRVYRGTFENAAGRFVQCTEPTQLHRQSVMALEITLPARLEAISLNPQQKPKPAA